MTTTINYEPWNVAQRRYETLAQMQCALDAAPNDSVSEDLAEQAHNCTADAIGLLIDTPAPTLTAATTKLSVIIRHAHLESPTADLSDPAVRATALADTMRDGAWPLLRVLEDLERLKTGDAPEMLQWSEAWMALNESADAAEDDEAEDLWDERDEYEDAILSVPCTTSAAALAKVRVMEHHTAPGQPFEDPVYHKVMKQLVGWLEQSIA